MAYFNYIDGGERAPGNISYYTNSPFGLSTSSMSAFTVNNKTVYFFSMSNASWNPPSLSSSTIYFGVRLYTGSLGNTLSFNNVNGNAQIYLTFNSNGSITVTRNMTVLGTSAFGLFYSNTVIYIEVNLVVNATTGSVIIKLNGNPTAILSLTNINTINDSSSLPIIGFSSNSNSSYWRDMYVIDGTGAAPYNTFLGSVGCYYLPPASTSVGSFSSIPSYHTTFVQNASQIFSGDPILSLKSTATPGNFLVALCMTYSTGSIASGWTQYGTTVTSSQWNVSILYQQVSNTQLYTSLSPITGTNGCVVSLYELTGYPTWNPDSAIELVNVATTGSLSFAPFINSTVNELQITLVTTNAGATTNIGLSGYTATDASLSLTSAGSAGTVSAVAGHRMNPAAGSTHNTTVTNYSGMVYLATISFITSSTIPNYVNAATLPTTGFYNQSSTVNAFDSFSLTSLPSNSVSVFGVKLFDYSYKNHSGARTLAKIITSGTTVATGTVQYLNETPIVTEDLYTVNPITSASWSPTTVNALIAGYKLIS